ncbi:MAG: CapA family protein [Eubacterium sp.]|nr:CapA family protein [Candidatus Colimonas fimequi]
MDSRELRRQRRKKKNRMGCIILILLVLCIIGAAGLLLSLVVGHHGNGSSGEPKMYEVKTISISNVGDVIIHDPFLRSTKYKSGDDYDYSDCFKYMKDKYSEPNYMVANLETTFGGKKKGYSGYPMFNSPDSLADAMSANGIDLFLTANNHIYDTGASGLVRTAQVLEEKGYDYTGIRSSEEQKRYFIKDIDGIKVGFINYVFETPSSSGKSMNGNHMDSSVADLVNSFKPSKLDGFYEEITKQIALMKIEGAEFIIVYPHWGEEYKLEAQEYPKKMAQRLCDIGVDAIIGGHPHVVEPIDVLTSEDGKHKTLVAYSMGNQLSNQRREMISSFPTGHTEDGLMIGFTLTRGTDGLVSITDIQAEPTWVYKSGNQQNPTYYVLPADDTEVLKSTGIDGVEKSAKASSERTHKIIDEGYKKAKAAYGIE